MSVCHVYSFITESRLFLELLSINWNY